MKRIGWTATLNKSRSWLVNSFGSRALRESMQRHLRGDIIDIGCGTKPMHSYTRGLVNRHIGIDHLSSLHTAQNVDVQSNAYQTPFRTNSFDCAICTAVLEHLEEPLVALRECFRLLKPGASALYTVPFIWHLHEEPRDFFRYSKYGLVHLFRLNRGPLKYIPIIPALGLVLQCLFLGLDKLDKTEIWTWAYLVEAKKPTVSELAT